MDESSVLDVVETVAALDDGINEGVEAGHVADLSSNSGGGTSRGLSEEVGSETVLRVVEESVLVAGVSSGGILAEELSLPEDVLG